MNLANAYRDEANDLLTDLEAALLELESQPDDSEVTSRVFRDLHTIKGSGAMAGFDKIAAFTHEVESVYDLVRGKKLAVSPRLISLTLLARDHIKTLLDGFEGDHIEAAGRRIISDFLQFQQAPTLPSPAALGRGFRPLAKNCTYRVRFKPPKNALERAIDLLRLLGEIRSLGICSVSCHTQGLPDIKDFEPETCYLFWDFILTTDRGEAAIHEVFQFVEDDSELEIVTLGDADERLESQRLGDILVERRDVTKQQVDQVTAHKKYLGELLVEAQSVAPDQVQSALLEQQHVAAVKQAAIKSAPGSLRVSAERLDDLVNIVGEIVTMQARLSQVATACGDPEVVFVSEEMERLIDKLRDNTMTIRMLPIGATFSNFRRLVRDLARDLGKQVELITEGGDTELDKSVIDQINDPLVHLIRNCVDHGLELPDKREALGKPKTGRIILSAEHSGAHVIVRIKDDGAGLDKHAICRKAAENGLIKAGQELTEGEIYALILNPGFSTAKMVSGLSGRGVGMDVVKQNVEALRGTLEIESKEAEGTTFTLKLPLTLAIIDGLLVRVSEQFFVLPLSNILECFELSAEAIRENHGRKFVVVRDEMVPYVEVREHFGMQGERPEISQVHDCRDPGREVRFPG